MILSIETTNTDFIKAVKAMAKLAGAKISKKKTTKAHKVPSKRLLSATKEAEKMRVDDKTYPSYNSVDEMMKDLKSKSQAPLTQIIKDFKKDKKAGKVKIYHDFAEFEKDLEKI